MLNHDSWLPKCAEVAKTYGMKIHVVDEHLFGATLPRADDDIIIYGRKVRGSACYVMYYAIVRKSATDFTKIVTSNATYFKWVLNNPALVTEFMGEMVAGNANFEVFYTAFLKEFAS